MIDLKKLNCNNYYVYDHVSEEHWYAQNGLRSLFNYSKKANKSFRQICSDISENGESVILWDGGEISLTLI